MKLTSASHWARIASGSGLLLAVAAVAVGYRLDHFGYSGTIVAWYRPLLEMLQAVGVLIIGGLIAGRLPHNVYGWLWLLIGWGAGVIQPWFSLLASLSLSASPPRWVMGGLAVQLTAVGWLTAVSMIPLILLLFPNGRLPSRRWRWVRRGWVAAVFIPMMSLWAVPGPSGFAPVDNPFGLPGVVGQMAAMLSTGAIAALFFVILPLATLSLFFRYRQGGAPERAQLRWLLFVAAANALFIAIDGLEIHQPWVSEEVMTDVGSLLLFTLPMAVAIAVLRYRLYDIDVIIRKTAVYATLSALLALVYFGTVILLQTLVDSVSGSQSPLVIVLSTLLIAALFAPLRQRVQHFIDRRFFRQKVDAQQVLARFAQTARDEPDMALLQGKLLDVVQETVQPERILVWLKPIKDYGRPF